MSEISNETIMCKLFLSEEENINSKLFPKLLYPLNNISLSCSIYTTIVIAYER